MTRLIAINFRCRLWLAWTALLLPCALAVFGSIPKERNSPNVHSFGSDFVQNITYDSADRISTLQSPAGLFTYSFNRFIPVGIALPNQSVITNALDSLSRLQSTTLKSSTGSTNDLHGYSYLPGGLISRRTRQTGNYSDFTYDNQGQLKTALGKEANDSARLNEQFGYNYDPAGNLYQRTNNGFLQTFTVNAANEITSIARANTLTVAGLISGPATSVSVNSQSGTIYGDNSFVKTGFTLADGTNTFTAIAQDSRSRLATNISTVFLPASVSYLYDANGNLTNNGVHTLTYTPENQLSSITLPSYWRTDFVYDRLGRLRSTKESFWQNSAWTLTNRVHYVYDGSLVIQERDASNVPVVTYTRGIDRSGSFQGAGGIGGLLARTDHITQSSAFYFSDQGGNVSTLLNQQQAVVAQYLYDSFGNSIGRSGPLAEVNRYQFSSKEIYPKMGFYNFGLRFYDPNCQRWLNQDSLGEGGGINLYGFVSNNPINRLDAFGLDDEGDDLDQRIKYLEYGGGVGRAIMAYDDETKEQHDEIMDEAGTKTKKILKDALLAVAMLTPIPGDE